MDFHDRRTGEVHDVTKESPWPSEGFGHSGFTMPDAVHRAMGEGMEDMSYRHDASPSVGRYWPEGEHEVRLWVDHPKPEERETGSAHRFLVTSGRTAESQFDVIHQGDDPHAAVMHTVKTIHDVHRRLRGE